MLKLQKRIGYFNTKSINIPALSIHNFLTLFVFLQLVSVYEVLLDEQKRARYNEVLKNGIPDWKHAVYYYRRVRKMGLLEMGVILFLIVTVGQYIVLWAAYAEKKYTAVSGCSS